MGRLQLFEKNRIKELAIEFIKEFPYSNQIFSIHPSKSIQKSKSNESVDSFYGDKNSQKETTNISNSADFLEKIEIELTRYSHSNFEPNMKCSKFWLLNEDKFPLLKQVAQVVLTATATSVPSEMIFSAGSNQVWEKINRLSAIQITWKSMFLNSIFL